jgi:hypothetical protein
VARRHPGIPAPEERRLIDAEVRALWELQAARGTARREAAAALKAQRDRAVARRREEAKAVAEAIEAERAGRECVHCGVPDAAGECPPCALAATTRRSVAEAVDLALTRHASDGPDAVLAAASVVEAGVWRSVREAAALEAADAVDEAGTALARAYAEQDAAQRLVAEFRADALAELEQSPPVRTEAEQLRQAVLRRTWPVTEAVRQRAEEVAADAASRTARDLLQQRLTAVQKARCPEPPVAGRRWTARLEEGRSLAESVA